MDAEDRMDVVLVGAITRQYCILFVLPFRLSGRCASRNVTLYTPIVFLPLAQYECANHSPEQPIKSSVSSGPHPLPRTPVDYSEQRVSDRFLPNTIDLFNEALLLPTSLGRAHDATR